MKVLKPASPRSVNIICLLSHHGGRYHGQTVCEREKTHRDMGRMLQNGYRRRLDHSFRTNSSNKTNINRLHELPVTYLLPSLSGSAPC